MLTIRRAGPRACLNCRLQLLSLFEHGFSNPNPTPTSNLLKPRRFPPSSRHSQLQSRAFSNTRRFLDQNPTLASSVNGLESRDAFEAKERDIEATVRHARQTFGETLPKDFLTIEEYALYERLYGPPVRETRGDDFEALGATGQPIAKNDEGIATDRGRNVLLRENADGGFDEVDFDPGFGYEHIEEAEAGEGLDFAEVKNDLEMAEVQVDGVVQVPVKSQREVDAILQLQRDMDTAMARPVEEEEEIDEEFEEEEGIEEEEEEEQYDEDEPDAYLSGDSIRSHPRTVAGRFGTSPSTLQLPQEQFIVPITELLSRTNNKHLTEAAERAFGGPGLPHSSSTPASKKLLPQKHIGLEPGQHRMTEIEADAYVAAVVPGTYAAVTSTLVEVRKRLGNSWIRDLFTRNGSEGPRILDAGAGGAGVIAWRQILAAEWEIMRNEGLVKLESKVREGKSTVLTGSTALRQRMSRILDDTTFLPRLPDYIHSARPETLLDGAPAEGRKSFDVIIAPHTLLPLKDDFRRKHMVQNLWSMLDPNGGVLILIEKGIPRGFEAIAGARALLLKSHIASPGSIHAPTTLDSHEEPVAKEVGMIIAPCTNHTQCPMYKIEGMSSGRKDFCHFGQRYERPGFLQRLLGAKHRNHEDVKYSYLAVRRGVDLRQGSNVAETTALSALKAPIVQGTAASEAAFAGYEDFDDRAGPDAAAAGTSAPNFSTFSLPRAVLPALKRRGHVTLDLCTPSGTLERWTVPKSFSTQAYRDARKLRHGDLWALGAKTRTLREARLGKKGEDGKLLSKRARQAGKKKDIFEVQVGESGMEGIREVKGGKRERGERRTKGGRLPKRERRIEDDNYMRDDD